MSTHDSDIVELVSMNQDEFRQLRKKAIQDYADGFIRDGLAAAEDAERKAEKEFDTYWPDGLATRNQHTYFVIDRINQQRVGEVQFDTGLRKHGIKGAWLSGYQIYDAFPLRDYLESTLRVLEKKLSEFELDTVAARLPPDDAVCSALFKTAGYRVLAEFSNAVYVWKPLTSLPDQWWTQDLTDEDLADKLRKRSGRLKEIHKRLADRVGEILTRDLGRGVTVSVEFQRVGSYAQFHKFLPDPRYTWSCAISPAKGCVEVDLSWSLGMALWSSLSGRVQEDKNEVPRLSIEEFWSMSETIEDSIRDLGQALVDEWNPVYPFDIRNINWQWALAAVPVPHQTNAPEPDDVTLHVNFAVRSGALSAAINLGYPSAMLKAFV